jgi:hypothetical protein
MELISEDETKNKKYVRSVSLSYLLFIFFDSDIKENQNSMMSINKKQIEIYTKLENKSIMEIFRIGDFEMGMEKVKVNLTEEAFQKLQFLTDFLNTNQQNLLRIAIFLSIKKDEQKFNKDKECYDNLLFRYKLIDKKINMIKKSMLIWQAK